MKKIFALLLASLLSFTSVYGEWEKLTTLESDNITESSVDLSWSPVDWYYVYEVSFSEESKEINDYNMNTDYIEWLSTTISDLESDTTYYFSLYWYDELWNKNILSDEIFLNTKSVSEVNELKVLDAEMYDLDKIKVTFSNELNDSEGTIRDFKISAVDDNFDTYDVIETEILEEDENSIILTLDSKPAVDKEYKIIVLDITDIYNQNIEYGIDSEIVFYAEETILEEVVEETNSWTVIDDTEEEVELNSAKEEEQTEANVTWTDLSEDDVNKNVVSVANENNKLPQTWPEQVLLLILAIIFSGLFFVSRFKKS